MTARVIEILFWILVGTVALDTALGVIRDNKYAAIRRRLDQLEQWQRENFGPPEPQRTDTAPMEAVIADDWQTRQATWVEEELAAIRKRSEERQ